MARVRSIPAEPGWRRNLTEQFERRKKHGFAYMELDNPDAYSVTDVVAAVDLAESYGLKVIAKNPGLMEGDPLPYVAHPNVHGIIVEKGAVIRTTWTRCGGAPASRTCRSGSFFFDARKGREAGKKAAAQTAGIAKQYRGMHVSYSPGGEYTRSMDETA